MSNILRIGSADVTVTTYENCHVELQWSAEAKA